MNSLEGYEDYALFDSRVQPSSIDLVIQYVLSAALPYLRNVYFFSEILDLWK